MNKEDKPIESRYLTIRDVEKITGNKAVRIWENANWIKMLLENGVYFSIKKWTV